VHRSNKTYQGRLVDCTHEKANLSRKTCWLYTREGKLVKENLLTVHCTHEKVNLSRKTSQGKLIDCAHEKVNLSRETCWLYTREGKLVKENLLTVHTRSKLVKGKENLSRETCWPYTREGKLVKENLSRKARLYGVLDVTAAPTSLNRTLIIRQTNGLHWWRQWQWTICPHQKSGRIYISALPEMYKIRTSLVRSELTISKLVLSKCVTVYKPLSIFNRWFQLYSYRRNFDPDKKNEIHYHSWKEHLKMSKIAKLRNVVKWGKYSRVGCEVRKFCIYLHYAWEK
jgi:ribosomal protein L35AE/L33A